MTTYVYDTLTGITSGAYSDLSINDQGQIAGDTYDSGTSTFSGFIYSDGSSTPSPTR